MFTFLKDIANYENRKVARSELSNGIVVSTAFTSDEGYETAIKDKNGYHPIERYDNREEAEQGHKKWLNFAQDCIGKPVIKLGGFSGPVDPEKIIIEI